MLIKRYYKKVYSVGRVKAGAVERGLVMQDLNSDARIFFSQNWHCTETLHETSSEDVQDSWTVGRNR